METNTKVLSELGVEPTSTQILGEPNEMDKKNGKKSKVLIAFEFLLLYIITIALTYGAALLWGLNVNRFFSLLVMSGIGNAFIIFIYLQEKSVMGLLYDNDLYEMRFIIVYFCCYVVALAFPLLPVTSWFFPAISVALMLFSNRYIAFVSSTFLLIQTVLLIGEAAEVFALFFICNMVVLFAFRYLDERFEVIRPIMITVCAQITMMTAMIIMFTSEVMSINLFLIPIINLFLTTLLLLIILKQFSATVVYQFHDKLLNINDQTYHLMVKLKEKAPETYMASIHTAYLVERIGQKLELDLTRLKSCAYYGHVNVLYGENFDREKFQKSLRKENFPNEIISLVEEVLFSKELFTKEATLVTICYELITIIGKIHQMNKSKEVPEESLNYNLIISNYMKKEYEAGRFDQTDLSIYEFKEMVKILKGEGLYYDFLC
ncbi:MAG: hypothetical protein R3Y54_05320 [Eubacteriales bacterium]